MTGLSFTSTPNTSASPIDGTPDQPDGLGDRRDRLLGLNYLAKILHPDLFSGLDPEAIHQEYIIGFQILDCDPTNHGVFVRSEE